MNRTFHRPGCARSTGLQYAVCVSRLMTLLALSWLLSALPHAWSQYVPPPALTGSTLGQNLRNAASATHTQVAALQTATDNWRRRAESAGYADAQFQQDFINVHWQFQQLRTQFDWLAGLARQLGRPRADNATAELEAGLNIINELFIFLDDQFAAGTLDRTTVIRTARVFHDAIREWDNELQKNTSRLGLAW